MIPMTLAEVAAVTGGYVDPPAAADVVVSAPASLDSRAVPADGLFVAVAGERVDGHDYAAGAVAAGAAAVLAARPVGAPAVVVDDPVVGLGRLARAVLDRLPDVTVVALTGSQGKTGTKDFLAHVLAAAGPTVATLGNLNNELGVPLTVLRADTTTSYLVVEMGARGIGHIAYLCEIAPPDAAAVLNVGTAHVGEFGSVDAIARAKGEIVEALGESGTAVLNLDDPRTRVMGPRTRARVLGFGAAGGPGDVTWRGLAVDDLGRPSVELGYDGAWAPLTLLLSGEHQVANAAAAAALAVGVGVPFDDVVTALGTARSASRWRMEIGERADGLVVVNDSYNANPASMAAAVDTLAAIGRRRPTARTVAVLGEMLELGDGADAAHRALGAAVADHGVDVLVAVGDAGALIAEGARAGATEVFVTPTREAALTWLRHNVSARDVVLVKASRGAALETVAAGLLAPSEPVATGAGSTTPASTPAGTEEGPTT